MEVNRLNTTITDELNNINSSINDGLLNDEVDVSIKYDTSKEINDNIQNKGAKMKENSKSKESIEDMLNALNITYEYVDNLIQMLGIESNKKIRDEIIKMLFIFHKDKNIDNSTVINKGFVYSSNIDYKSIIDLFSGSYGKNKPNTKNEKENNTNMNTDSVSDFNDFINRFKSNK